DARLPAHRAERPIAEHLERGFGDGLDPKAVPRQKALVHAIEVRGEEASFLASRPGANLDDRIAVVEGIARDEERFELLLDVGDLRFQSRLFRARLGGQIRVVNENELAYLRELVLEFSESGGRLGNRGEPPVLSPELGQPLSIAERGRIGECSLDLVGAGEHFSESVAKAQWNASASLLLLLA